MQSYGDCSKLIPEQKEPHDCGRSFFRNELFMRAGWNAEAMEPNVYHKAEDLNDDDDASMYVRGDDFMVELMIDVFQDAKVMSEHKVDIEVSTIIRLGQNTKAKIVKRVSSRRPAGITWVRLEQSRAAALTPRTAATTKTTKNTSDELSWKRAKAISMAGGTAIYLVLNRLDIAYNIRRANRDISKLRMRTEARLKRSARSLLGKPEFVWTFPNHEMTQTSVRKDYTNWTDQDIQDHKCFNCLIVRLW